MELSFPGAKVTWNFRSRERKSPGTFVLGNENDVELSLSIRIHASNTKVIIIIILYQTVTARMSPKYSRNLRADFTQRHSLHS